MYSWVGWGGAGRGMYKRSCELAGHAMLWLPAGACIHGLGGVAWHNNVHGSLFHRSCYANLCCLELCAHASCYATVCSLELCTHASCYAILCVLLNFPLVRHATLLYVFLNFALMGHASVLYVLLNFAVMGHAMHPSVTQYVLMGCWRSSLQSPDPERFLEALL